MKLLSAAVASIISAATGAQVTEDSNEQTIRAAVEKLTAERDGLRIEIAALKSSAKTADERAREIAAMHGSAGTPKDLESVKNASDGKAIYDAYQAAMKAGHGAKAAEIWAKHEKAIAAYVATLD